MNNNNIYIGNLFLRNSTKSNDHFSVEDRIKKYIEPEGHDWAQTFCTSIMAREDYKDIKSFLNKIKIDVLVRYHEEIQALIGRGCSTDELKQYFETISSIISLTKQVAGKVATSLFSSVADSINISDVDKRYEDITNTLSQPNNYILMQAIETYISESTKRYADSINGLDKIIMSEVEHLPKYLWNQCKNLYNNYIRLLENKNEREYNNYQNSFLTNLYHNRDNGRQLCKCYRVGGHVVRKN